MSFICAAAALWGLWPFWVRGVGGAAAAVIAVLAGGAVGLPAALRASRRRAERGERVGRRAGALLLALSVANSANIWLYFRALSEGEVAPAALSHYLAPVIVAVLAPLVLGEPRATRTPVALVLAIAGTAALLVSGGADTGGGSVRHAALLGGGSAVFYAACVLIGKRLMRGFEDSELYAYQCLISAAMLLPVTALPPLGSAWIRPVIGGVVSSAIAGMLYYAGLRRMPAERVGVLSYMEVLAGVLVGWIAFHERPSMWALAGGVAIVAAGALVITSPTVAARRR